MYSCSKVQSWVSSPSIDEYLSGVERYRSRSFAIAVHPIKKISRADFLLTSLISTSRPVHFFIIIKRFEEVFNNRCRLCSIHNFPLLYCLLQAPVTAHSPEHSLRLVRTRTWVSTFPLLFQQTIFKCLSVWIGK